MIEVNYEQDAVYFALENSKLKKEIEELRKYALDSSHAIMNMIVAFNTLSTDGGWDTLPKKHQDQLIEYRDQASNIFKKIPF
jgi:hypothetical protein